jgi:hypothetical protein
MVQIVALVRSSLANSTIATSGQQRKAALATQYGDIRLTSLPHHKAATFVLAAVVNVRARYKFNQWR